PSFWISPLSQSICDWACDSAVSIAVNCACSVRWRIASRSSHWVDCVWRSVRVFVSPSMRTLRRPFEALDAVHGLRTPSSRWARPSLEYEFVTFVKSAFTLSKFDDSAVDNFAESIVSLPSIESLDNGPPP